MAARQVTRAPRGFTILEMMATVAIIAILVGLSANALNSATRVSRVGGQARFILQRLQSLRTSAVTQGAAQGYNFGPNGPGAAGPDANQGFVFYKANPATTAPSVSFNSVTDRTDATRDWLPLSNNTSVVVVTGGGVPQPAAFEVGFDMNGLVTVTPPSGFPFCIRVTDAVDVTIFRSVILFNDGTAKIQKNETWCP